MSDLISRQALIEHLRRTIEASSNDGDYNEGFNDGMDFAACFASALPSAQPDRDTPKKPTATTDKSWGIPHRQAVCPNCDCFLGTVYFICDGNGKRKVTYCESCGQAIDWEGWNEDESD